MPANPHSHYTVMFIPDDRSKPYTLRIRRNIVRTVASLVALWAAALVFFLLILGRVSIRLHMVNALEKERVRLVEENRALAAALKKADQLMQVSEYLGQLADMTIRAGQGNVTSQAPEAVIERREQPHTEAQTIDGFGAVAAPAAPSDVVTSAPSIIPVDGWITKRFSAAIGPEGHAGIDIAAAAGSPIRAPSPGTVINIMRDAYLGLMLELDHGHGFRTRYGHCMQTLVARGERVARGQTLALVGSTGRSTAPHLHYEVLYHGVAQDPEKYFLKSVDAD